MTLRDGASFCLFVCTRLRSRIRISGSAEFLPPPENKITAAVNAAEFVKIWSAAVKTSAKPNPQLSLPFLLSLKLYNSLADFKREIWVCLQNGLAALHLLLRSLKV